MKNLVYSHRTIKGCNLVVNVNNVSGIYTAHRWDPAVNHDKSYYCIAFRNIDKTIDYWDYPDEATRDHEFARLLIKLNLIDGLNPDE